MIKPKPTKVEFDQEGYQDLLEQIHELENKIDKLTGEVNYLESIQDNIRENISKIFIVKKEELDVLMSDIRVEFMVAARIPGNKPEMHVRLKHPQ